MAYEMKKEKREIDNCVSCGEETEYYKDTHIYFRKHYIEGPGSCARSVMEKFMANNKIVGGRRRRPHFNFKFYEN